MPSSPFTVALNPSVQVMPAAEHYTLQGQDPMASTLTLDTYRGLEQGLEHLQRGEATREALVQTLTHQTGPAAGVAFAATLQQLEQQGWLTYAVSPLAIAEPLVETAQLNLDAPHWTAAKVSLSRFAYQHTQDGSMVLESPLSAFRVKLADWRASAILAQLAQPAVLGALTPPPQLGAETAVQFLNLLWATNFLSLETETPALRLWDFHNLLFHSRSRLGRHDYPTEDIAGNVDIWDQFPVVKPPMSEQVVTLPQISIDAIRQRDRTLTTAIEKRTSIRQYDENNPITIEQLGELLYRSARVQEIYTFSTELQELGKEWYGEDFDWGESSRRPYPCGGSMYELEVYAVVRRCEGISAGLYHYDPLHHQLAQLDATDADRQAFLQDAYRSSGEQGMPQVLLIMTARFGRLFRKYRSLAYALVLKHVGVLHQNLYLVATNMDLAPCALGGGDSDRFARVTGLDYEVESSVGEFMLGSLPASDAQTSGGHTSSVSCTTSSGAIAPAAPAQEDGKAELKAIAPASSDDTPETLAGTAVDIAPADAPEPDIIAPAAPSDPTEETAALSPSQPPDVVTAAPPIAEYPHDLDERITGLAELRNQTLGDPRITIVILDGDPDHSLSCFEGAEVSKVFPYWHPPAEPVPTAAYLEYQAINNNDDLDKATRHEKLKEVFPETLLSRIFSDSHASHITSTIVGQENTPVPGLAPRCRVINVPLNAVGTAEELMSPLNLARAFELGLELGANIIHCAICRPTQTGEGEEILVRALQKCQDNNILVVAPAGNDKGKCWCLPAVLPGVLSVGALKPDGSPYKFSNWGGNNASEGIMAPGGEILGAQPGNEEPIRQKGTSAAAPVMTGLCALLMSLQLQQDKPVDAEAVRAALLNTATPCTADDTDEPERCLRGKVNLPGAMGRLFGVSVTLSFAGDQVTRTEYPALVPAAVPLVSAPDIGRIETPARPEAATVITGALAATSQPLAAASPDSVQPSTAHSGQVYTLGTIGYDFGDETRRDTFAQTMAPVERNGLVMPPDPQDIRQMIEHLDNNPDAAHSLIWTLSLDENILYALDPKGPFANDIYELFLLMLNGQLEPDNSAELIERLSIPGRQTSRTVELLSGEVVPVLNVHNPRGMYGWNSPALVESALATVLGEGVETMAQEELALLREGLAAFLSRVYFDLHNVGQTSRDRALNFATTNIFQAASSFVDAIASNRHLDTIAVEKSPYCRLNSDCWDLLLTFYDPEDGKRSRQVFRFTVDVADAMPVTVGQIKRWSIPGAKP
ncbi:MAG: PatA/PatG family cyanobactin maturation protease [Cyanobacteria bacterium P01_G01_bin.54]